MEIADLKNISASVRKEILKMLQKAGSGHPGGSLSAVELLVDLYVNHMNFNKNNCQKQRLFRFIERSCLPRFICSSFSNRLYS